MDSVEKDQKDKEVIDWCKKSYDSNRALIKHINHEDNASRIGLTKEQVISLAKYIQEAIDTNGESCGTYRYLIYTVLEGVGYADGMYMGLLDLNNKLVDLSIQEPPNHPSGN